tara:strand:+ start:1098 stop:1265 length:168 start_codon:yes stop_codon:yes gene_type:complete
MKFNHPLMFNNFTKADMVAVIKMLKIKNEILTQSKYVKMFEKNGLNGLEQNIVYL